MCAWLYVARLYVCVVVYNVPRYACYVCVVVYNVARYVCCMYLAMCAWLYIM